MCASASPCGETEEDASTGPAVLLETGGDGEANDTSGALFVGTLWKFMFVAVDWGGVGKVGVDADEREKALGKSLAFIAFDGSTLPAPIIASGADGGTDASVSWLLL